MRAKLKIDYYIPYEEITIKKGTILEKECNYYEHHDSGNHFHMSYVENNSSIFELLEPILYTEDFEDGSHPKKSCSNCLNDTKRCSVQEPWNNRDCPLWNNILMGAPIYKGDKCWLVCKGRHDTVSINYSDWTGIRNPNFNRDFTEQKYFSNKDNATAYYNKLKWQNNLKFKIGDSVEHKNWNEVQKNNARRENGFVITGINWLNACYEIDDSNQPLYFNNQYTWKIYQEPKLEIGKWYKFGEIEEYVLYLGKELVDGFNCGRWIKDCNTVNNHTMKFWKLADMDKVKELLLNEAKRRYPIGTKIICTFNKDIRTIYTHDNIDNNLLMWTAPNKGQGAFVFNNGKWAEIVEPKFITADGIKKHFNNNEYVFRYFSDNSISKTLVDSLSLIDYYNCFDKLSNAEQYLAEQIAAKRGIKVGTELFDDKKKYIGKCIKIRPEILNPNKAVIEHSITNSYNTCGIGLDYIYTLEELVAEEGIEVGMEIDREFLQAWQKYNNYSMQFFTNTIDRFEIVQNLNNQLSFVINEIYFPIVGFKAFKEKWEKEQSAKCKVNQLGFKVGDKVWSKSKYYQGEILRFEYRGKDNILCAISGKNEVVNRIEDITNKVAIHTPTKEDFGFIKTIFKETDNFKLHRQYFNIKFKTGSDCKANLEYYLILSVDEYMQSIGEKPLFITENKINVWNRDQLVWVINLSTDDLFQQRAWQVMDNKYPHLKFFSTEQAAKDYLKPLKSKFKYDRWYKYKGCPKYLVFLSKECGRYGFNIYGKWFSEDCTFVKENDSLWELADDSTVEQRLLEYAKTNYPKNTKFENVRDSTFNGYVNGYMFGTNNFNIVSNGNHLYLNGKWAKKLGIRLTLGGYETEICTRGILVKGKGSVSIPEWKRWFKEVNYFYNTALTGEIGPKLAKYSSITVAKGNTSIGCINSITWEEINNVNNQIDEYINNLS